MVNASKQVLYLSYIGRVTAEELKEGRKDLPLLLAPLKPNFRLVTDLSQLDFMGVECGKEIGKIMELCDQKDVGVVVRVIPDPAKDIGMEILSMFHYLRPPEIFICRDIVEAAKILAP